jgi:biopolymer transport protein ExbD
MFLHARKRDELTINLTPLIDVVFLLLIFFMVTTTFSRNSELALSLPEADHASAPKEEPNTVDIAIDAQGNFVVNGKRLVDNSPDTLARALERLEVGEHTPVVLSGDAKVDYQAVITAMDVLTQRGVTRLKLATRDSGR